MRCSLMIDERVAIQDFHHFIVASAILFKKVEGLDGIVGTISAGVLMCAFKYLLL